MIIEKNIKYTNVINIQNCLTEIYRNIFCNLKLLVVIISLLIDLVYMQRIVRKHAGKQAGRSSA
jgi:hypothetical protein